MRALNFKLGGQPGMRGRRSCSRSRAGVTGSGTRRDRVSCAAEVNLRQARNLCLSLKKQTQSERTLCFAYELNWLIAGTAN